MQGVVWVPAPLELLVLVQRGREKGRPNTAGVMQDGFKLAFVRTGRVRRGGNAMDTTQLGLAAVLVPTARLSSSVTHGRKSQAVDWLRPENTGAGEAAGVNAVSPFNIQLACRDCM